MLYILVGIPICPPMGKKFYYLGLRRFSVFSASKGPGQNLPTSFRFSNLGVSLWGIA